MDHHHHHHHPTKQDDGRRRINLSNAYGLAGILSALAWIVTAYVALSFHPDPKFADCTLRHNLLTMSQAFAFPLPVAWASFEALRTSASAAKNANANSSSRTSRKLNAAVAIASFWLAASSAFPPAFAFGYDLYPLRQKIAVSTIHAVTGTFALAIALRRSTSTSWIRRGLLLGPTTSTSRRHRHRHRHHRGNNNNSSSSSRYYATGAAGLLYFAIQPIVSPYPLATIPTILGKRLSRPASAFTLLGAVMAHCLIGEGEEEEERNNDNDNDNYNGNAASDDDDDNDVDDGDSIVRTTLRRGLAWGTSAHLCLIFMKIIGVDGGGLIFRGRGLWEVYPAMISVPFAAGVSFAVHAILCFGALTEETSCGEDAVEDEKDTAVTIN